MQPVSVVGASIGDTILVPAGEIVSIPIYGQNWIDRTDALNFIPSDEEGWAIFTDDHLAFFPIEDSMAIDFPIEFDIPEVPLITTNEVKFSFDHSVPMIYDTVRFVLIVDERRPTHLYISRLNLAAVRSDTIQFTHILLDQFGDLRPHLVTWEAEGGEIDSTGLYVAGSTGGIFAVTAIAGDVSSQVTVVVDGEETTALDETNLNKLGVQVYPNPFLDKFNLSYSQKRDHKMSFTIHDVFGRNVKVLTRLKGQGRHQISVDGIDLAPGIHFFKLQVGSVVRSGKILKI